jgi:hypothetical protein
MEQIFAIAYKQNSTSPYYVEKADSIVHAQELLERNAVLDNYAFVQIKMFGFATNFHWTDFTKSENYVGS